METSTNPHLTNLRKPVTCQALEITMLMQREDDQPMPTSNPNNS